MIFKHPGNEEIPQLLNLWKNVFGEYDGFWELFRNIAFLLIDQHNKSRTFQRRQLLQENILIIPIVHVIEKDDWAIFHTPNNTEEFLPIVAAGDEKLRRKNGIDITE